MEECCPEAVLVPWAWVERSPLRPALDVCWGPALRTGLVMLRPGLGVAGWRARVRVRQLDLRVWSSSSLQGRCVCEREAPQRVSCPVGLTWSNVAPLSALLWMSGGAKHSGGEPVRLRTGLRLRVRLRRGLRAREKLQQPAGEMRV